MKRKEPTGPGTQHDPRNGRGDGKPCPAPDAGIALIITLWITLIVSVIAVTFAYEARTDMHMMGYSVKSIQAHYLARAGMARAMILLREDILKDQDVLEREHLVELDDKDVGYRYDAFSEEWYSGVDGNYDDVEVEGGISRDAVVGTYTVRVIDESSRVNLNYRSTTQDVIQGLLIAVGVEDEEEAQALAAVIIDWRDTDDLPSDGGDAWEFGDEMTEDTYYNPHQDPRDIEENGADFVCKNGPYGAVEELLLVMGAMGIPPSVFFGEDVNGNGKLDRNEDDGDETYPPDNEDGELQLGLRHYVTVDSRGPVNINTASEPVLRALLSTAVDEKKTERLAERIVDYRLGPDGRAGTRDDRPLRMLDGSDEIGNSLTEIPSFDPNILTVLRSLLVVESDTFTIVSEGSVGGARRVVRATVFREFREKAEVEEDEGPDARRRDRRYQRMHGYDESERDGGDPRDDDQGRIYTKRYSEGRVYGEPVAEGREKRKRG